LKHSLALQRGLNASANIPPNSAEDEDGSNDEDTYADDRVAGSADNVMDNSISPTASQSLVGRTGAPSDGFALIGAAEALKAELSAINISPQHAFPSIHAGTYNWFSWKSLRRYLMNFLSVQSSSPSVIFAG
jgi:hypothetical protein